MSDASEMFDHEGQDRWTSFMDEPVSYTNPLRLSACLGNHLSGPGCVKLVQTPRLSRRISDLLIQSYNLDRSTAPDDEQDRSIALSDADQLRSLAIRSGAIYWSNSLAGIILNSDAQALSQRLGDELWMLSLQNRDLGGEVWPIDSVESVIGQLHDDGWRCLSAWCNTQPAAIGRRVRLKLPPNVYLDAPAEGDIGDLGPRIVRRAAS